MTAAETKCTACNGTGKVKVSVLKQLRERKGVTQAEAGAALGITQAGYSRMEKRGPDWNMRYGTWAKLEKYFGATRAQLQGEAPLTAPKPARPTRRPDPASLSRSKKNKAAIAAKNRKGAR